MKAYPYRAPLILAAMPEEQEALLEAAREITGAPLPGATTLDARLGISFQEHVSEAKLRILIARSGVGPVNAALACALIARARPEIDSVILLGVGGALAPELGIGELVVSSSVLQHDSFSSLDFGHPRMAAGQFVLTPEDAASHVAPLRADPGLTAWLAGACPAARSGAVLSGSEFVGTLERKRAIAALHAEALLVDMEAAGVAQVATRLGLPFAIAKTVADRLQPDGTIENDFRSCLAAAARNAAEVLRRLLGARP